MRILISSIIRERIKTLPTWREQILRLAELNPTIEFSLSVAENGSRDGSKDFIRQADFGKLKSYIHIEEDLGTPYYGSVKNEERVKILAIQRNKTIDQVDLTQFDKILFLEPDIIYNPEQVSLLFYSDADMISPRSTQGACQMYDSWSVRRTDKETDCYEIITDERTVYATWCQFCIVKAKPFIDHNIRFSGFNDRMGHYDNDVTAISEGLHEYGYHNIKINGAITVEHLPH